MKLSPFAIYFAGVGTVVTALAVGFGSAVFLTSTPDAKETVATRNGEAKLTKVEKFQAAKREEASESGTANASTAASASTLLAATITVPVDLKPATAASLTTPPEKAPAPRSKQQPEQEQQHPAATPRDGVQGTASFEGADNAVEIKPSKKPIAEAAKSERKRRVAQRKTRDVVVQSRRGGEADVQETAREEDAPVVVYRRGPGGDYRAVDETYRTDDGPRIVRTYEARSRGFGLFETEDD
jgi:hypothetical protein